MRRIHVLTIALAMLTAAPLAAEPLPVRSYTTNDGLAHDWVLRVRRDWRGLLWFCTYGN
jgi:hypothetical protein